MKVYKTAACWSLCLSWNDLTFSNSASLQQGCLLCQRIGLRFPISFKIPKHPQKECMKQLVGEQKKKNTELCSCDKSISAHSASCKQGLYPELGRKKNPAHLGKRKKKGMESLILALYAECSGLETLLQTTLRRSARDSIGWFWQIRSALNRAWGRCYSKDTGEVFTSHRVCRRAGNGRASVRARVCVLMPRDVPHCGWAACILQGNSCPALTGTDKWHCSTGRWREGKEHNCK